VTRPSRQKRERGVTLIELMIAVSITAVVVVGLMFALRTSVVAYQTTGDRLRANRAQMNRNQILARELGAAMPVLALCGNVQTLSFTGGPQSMHLVSSYSIAEGFRGYPQIVEIRVRRGSSSSSSGGLQLVASEQPYTGPGSTASLCGSAGGESAFSAAGSAPVVLADDLAACTFSYRPPRNPLGVQESEWVEEWDKRMTLPAAIRIEMKPNAPAGGGLPAVTVTVPLRIDRDLFRVYAD